MVIEEDYPCILQGDWVFVKTEECVPTLQIKCIRCQEWKTLIDHTVSDDGFIDPLTICGCGLVAKIGLKNFKRLSNDTP